MEIRQLGGQLAAPPLIPDAVDGREAPWNLWVTGNPLAEPDAVAASIRRIEQAMRPWSYGLALPNLVPTGAPARAQDFYRGTTRRRLASIGAQFDPRGVLAVGQVVRDLVSNE